MYGIKPWEMHELMPHEIVALERDMAEAAQVGV